MSTFFPVFFHFSKMDGEQLKKKRLARIFYHMTLFFSLLKGHRMVLE
jgi:hypothetical protein